MQRLGWRLCKDRPVTTSGSPATAAKTGAGLVLAVLASGQFLMTLDSSVMNVSMATVAADLGTTITGIQTAITLYTLVMATLMITGGKLGTIMGRRKAFGIGLVIYAAGSTTTALAPNLTVLLIGWSFLEGIGAALIMPAIVALVASNFPADKRAAAYGMVAAAGALAVAAGPLIGGAVTTYASWRYVFLGEVVIVLAILTVLRKIADVPPEPSRIDLFGSLLSVVGPRLVRLRRAAVQRMGVGDPEGRGTVIPECLATPSGSWSSGCWWSTGSCAGRAGWRRPPSGIRMRCNRWCDPACCVTGS